MTTSTLMGPALMTAMTSTESKSSQVLFYIRDSASVDILNLAHCKLISNPIFLPCFSKSGFCTLVYAHSTKPCLKNNSNRSPCTRKLNILMCQPKDDQVGQFDCLLDHLTCSSYCEIHMISVKYDQCFCCDLHVSLCNLVLKAQQGHARYI